MLNKNWILERLEKMIKKQNKKYDMSGITKNSQAIAQNIKLLRICNDEYNSR